MANTLSSQKLAEEFEFKGTILQREISLLCLKSNHLPRKEIVFSENRLRVFASKNEVSKLSLQAKGSNSD